MYKFSQIPVACEEVNTKYRIIQTKIPAPSTISILESCAKNEPNSMNDQLPIAWERAKNFSIYDNAGNKWIDFTSSIFVANVGHANEWVDEAIRKTLDKQLLNAYYYPTQERASFSQLLVDTTSFEKILFLSTGSESVEAAIKMAMKFTGKKKILSFMGAFHGKTMGSAYVGKLSGQQWAPETDYVHHIEYPNSWTLEEKNMSAKEFFENQIKGLEGLDIAAVIFEPYQGWSAEFMSKEYAQLLRKWCDDNGVLMIIDEIQSGFGRTGKLFAYEHFEIIPDIVTCAKGISSSLPLSCVLTRAEIANVDMSFNSTHGGNPIAISASNASVKYLLHYNLIKESERKGKILHQALLDWKSEMPEYIERINCRGLLASVFINSPDGNNNDFVDKIIEVAMRKGLMSVRTASGTLKIGPPLTITDDALIEGLEVLKESLRVCLDI